MTAPVYLIGIAAPEQAPRAFMCSARRDSLGGPWTGLATDADRFTHEEATRGADDWNDYFASKGYPDRCTVIEAPAP